MFVPGNAGALCAIQKHSSGRSPGSLEGA
jgi:hypothetical protein